MKRLAIAAAALLAAVPAAAQHQGHGQHRPPPPPGGPSGEHARAHQADERAIMAVVDRMFAALAAKSPDGLLAEVVPEGLATASVRGQPGGPQSVRWPEFAAHLARIPGRPAERLIDPHVHVEGDIAMIWSRYVFEMDGRFLHCGVDHFDLVRRNGQWKVLNLTWTQQTENCPERGPAPLHPPMGPPRQPPGERG